MTPAATVLDRHLRAAIREFGSPPGTGGRDMDTKARLLADRIAATNKRVDAKMEAVGKRLDAIDKREPEVFGRVDQWIDSKNSDVGAIEDTLNKLSNISFEQDSSSGK